MKNSLLFLLILLSFSCQKKEYDLTVKGTVKGLKKGTIYLQKINDTIFYTVDSVSVKGSSSFELHSELDSPEMFYLYLNKNDNTENRISFFADKGITEIHTTLKGFAYNAEIIGSKQQEALSEYRSMIRQFNDKSLDLLKANFEAQKEQNFKKADSINKVYNRYNMNRFKYALNFSMNHLDSEVTPYIVLSDMNNATMKILDTVCNNLSDKVLNSKYGLELKQFIKELKLKEEGEANN